MSIPCDERRYLLRHSDGRFYSFAGGENYDGPQFCRDYRSAKKMTKRGAANVKSRLSNPKWHGERFEIVTLSEAKAHD